MSTGSIALIARRSIGARIGRLLAIAIAILVGVAFVVGSFVLADSLRRTFSDLFTQISEDVDLEVRSTVAFEQGGGTQERDPIPAELAEQIAAVEGVSAIEPLLLRYAQLVDKDGNAITTQGAPTYGTAWTGAASLSGLEIKGEGQAPSGPDQIAIDAATAEREDYVVGDTIEVITDVGRTTYTITALVGLGDSDGFAGATLAAWDVPTASAALGAGGFYDGVDVAVGEGTDVAAVQARLEQILPEGTEVVTRDVLIAEGEGDVEHVHQRVPERPARVRLRHRLRQRLPDQQRVPDHDRSAVARAGTAARRRRVGPPGAPDDLRRGADHGDPRHGAGDRRRHLRRPWSAQPLQRRRRRVPRFQHRAHAAHRDRRRDRRRRHHAALGRRAGPPGGRASHRSRRCDPSSGSTRCAPAA